MARANRKKQVGLGDEVTDLVSGFRGVAVARTTWLNGCVRVMLQPKVGKDRKVPAAETFDVEQLEVVKTATVPVVPVIGGGGRPDPSRHAAPKRR